MAPNAKTRRCKFCLEQIPEDRPRSLYCKDSHRAAWHNKLKREKERARAKHQVTPEHVKKIKALAFNNDESEMANLVRSVFEESVRDEINQHVRDNLLGLTEVLVDMAPEAIRALQEDLSSEDDYVRSRAYALWFKYVMPMQKEAKSEEDNSPVQVILHTPLTERIAALRDDKEAEYVDVSDWPECYVCHKTKHPDAMRRHDDKRHICTTCAAKKDARTGHGNPMALLDSELFG